jgi:glycosyltransferase involved in cell wall biosynthesis
MVLLRIVIPTKNEEKYLPKLLDSIKNQSFKDLEIVVSDANSSDKTREIAKKYGCRVVNGGLPDIGRNNGTAGCKAPLVCFIDSDIVLPDRNYIKKSIKEFNLRELDVAGGIQKPTPADGQIEYAFFKIFYMFANYGMILFENSKNPLMQSFMLMKTKVFRDAGGFLPYEFGEDAAFAKMAVAKGYKFGILRTPGEAFISHRRFKTNGILKMLLKYAYFNGMRLLGKEFERGKTKIKYFD